MPQELYDHTLFNKNGCHDMRVASSGVQNTTRSYKHLRWIKVVTDEDNPQHQNIAIQEPFARYRLNLN